ncbi:methyl-accepting chemotaxis protein [Afipia carboxidovorans OM5]|nr:methyl-accepting chemotaxis protein [Afipia carboxidovorans OM5]
MAMDDAWTKDDKGNIIVFPLVGYETRVVENRALALRLPFMMQGDDQTRPSGSLQLIISSADDVRDFGQALIDAADRIEKRSKGA